MLVTASQALVREIGETQNVSENNVSTKLENKVVANSF